MIPQDEVDFGRARVKQPNRPWRGVRADPNVGAKTGLTIAANDMAGPKRHRRASGDVPRWWKGIVFPAHPITAILRVFVSSAAPSNTSGSG